MPIHASSVALRAELRAGSIQTPVAFRASARTYLQAIQKVGQQTSILQQLQVDVAADEKNPRIQAKLESLRQTFRAKLRCVQRTEKENDALAQVIKEYEAEAADLVAMKPGQLGCSEFAKVDRVAALRTPRAVNPAQVVAALGAEDVED